jgi:preprotein translocase subunit SecA
MFASLVAKIFGTANARTLRQLQPLVSLVNAHEPAISKLSDEQLREKTNEFRKQLEAGKTLDDILPEAYAVAREAAKRILGMRPFDVQIMGAIVLHQGKIAEMKTGEGKTLTATLPLYLNALSGKGAHCVTVNDYLAKRDAEWNKPLYNFLGLEVGCLQNNMEEADRKKAYEADILYATNSELGFDYLRDNMKFRLSDYVQRDLNFAIVDEVDSILIDEARTPLIISGPSEESSSLYLDANKAAARLTAGVDYEVDEKARSVQLTESGIDKIEDSFRIQNLYAPEHLNVLHRIGQALRAHALFRSDVDYVVKDGEVAIVDEFTGRILKGRRYSDGLHQALEAKEGVKIEQETQTLASITLQNFFRLYKKLAGMTGTAMTEAEEFHKIYKLDVVSIPTHRPVIRDDKQDMIFLTKRAKYETIAKDVKERYTKGQPVLIGTVAIETSELLSLILKQHGIPHEVLNAKQHAREAEIVAGAGKKGSVTIATNMAGRGTDIKLEPASIAAGGLYILGTERHESRRIDNQLRGRSGRQGDPGESRFYISLEDDLVRIFGGENLKQTMIRWGRMKESDIIESPYVSKRIEASQERVEKTHFESRKHLLEYDDVLNQHRNVIYEYRRNLLDRETDATGMVNDMIASCIEELIAHHCPEKIVKAEHVAELFKAVSLSFALPVKKIESAQINRKNIEQLATDLINFIEEQYALYATGSTYQQVKDLERWVMIETLDKAWKQHMLNIDHLKEGIWTRGYGNKNALYEYKREAFEMFKEMMRMIRWDIVQHIFHINAAHINQQLQEAAAQAKTADLKIDKLKTNSDEIESSLDQNFK